MACLTRSTNVSRPTFGKKCSIPSVCRVKRSLVARAVGEEQAQASSDPSPSSSSPVTKGSDANPSNTPSTPMYRREFKSLGSQVIEQDVNFEEPPEKDMWEGEQFEVLGQVLERWFLPGLVVLGLICGGIAAGAYNDDATVFIKPASGPDELPAVVPAAALTGPPIQPAPSP